jgi:hypothetical protein
MSQRTRFCAKFGDVVDVQKVEDYLVGIDGEQS